ncbi:MAG TPA: hypothetical protein EYH03_07300 [Chromatiales bacterium]|nr:hypothetical protein [Chromatiales bacterium]
MGTRAKHDSLRERVAYEAARILLDFGSLDYAAARRKAARRLGVAALNHLPNNNEIQQALIVQQQLFRSAPQSRALAKLRRGAVEAMRAFAAFKPRLTGAVLDGSADEGSPVQLWLFAETPEEVVLSLLEKRIPWEEAERTLHFSRGEKRSYPVFRFQAGTNEVELLVMPPVTLRNPPLDPMTHKPTKGARVSEVEALCDLSE